MNFQQPEEKGIALLLRDMGRHVRSRVRQQSCAQTDSAFAQSVSEVTEADTIYGIDRWSEEAIFEWMEEHWPRSLPVEIIAEGLEEHSSHYFPADADPSKVRVRLIIDPIDGTRELMYDKRSAWFLAAVASTKTSPGSLQDLSAAAMVELPPRKQALSDEVVAWKEKRSAKFYQESTQWNLGRKHAEKLSLTPSKATDLCHGFTCFVKFFPEGKKEITELEDAFIQRHLSEKDTPKTLVFDDQYISTGGQFHALLAGQYRFVADLRPLVYHKLGREDFLACHPYDLAGLPALWSSDIIIEDPWGNPLNAPLDTTTPVAWVAYANETLAQTLRPLLLEVLSEFGYHAPTGCALAARQT